MATRSPVIRSGIPNFCAVALAFNELGYKAVGIRLDSGNFAYLSCQARKIFCCIEKEFTVSGFGKTSITASNDLNEETLDALNKQWIEQASEPNKEAVIKAVLLAGVPGAGGFDDVFAVTLGDSSSNVTKTWSSFNVLALLVKEDPCGVSLESADPRTNEITSAVSSIHIE
ncbi:hypothetical protein S83_008999 [Arachis hypogaea]